MTSTTDRTADQQLKARHRALWASGDYPAVAADLIPTLGPELVRAAGVRPGQHVLDVGAGSGNAAIPAAATGATVTASDLTPELLAAGREIAAQRGVELEWVEADAEALPSPTAASTWCCRRSARCSHRVTRSSPTSWSASPAPAAPSRWPTGPRTQRSTSCSPPVDASGRLRRGAGSRPAQAPPSEEPVRCTPIPTMT